MRLQTLGHPVRKHEMTGLLINPPKNLNYDMVREFYTNALPYEGDPLTFSTMIRGRTIHFSRDAINEYLGNPMVLK